MTSTTVLAATRHNLNWVLDLCAMNDLPLPFTVSFGDYEDHPGEVEAVWMLGEDPGASRRLFAVTQLWQVGAGSRPREPVAEARLATSATPGAAGVVLRVWLCADVVQMSLRAAP